MTIEEQALRPKWLDAIASRVKLEMRRLDKQVRSVVREQILKVISGKAESITPTAILNHIGLTESQMATVERARTRLLAEGKLKGKALEKDLDKLRAKLLRERASLIAEHETRMAHALGQRAAWEKLFADKKLAGGKRHWHKLWIASEDERTCGVCMDLDGQEVPVDSLFDDSYYSPPEPHPRCRCSVALVETTPGWRSEKSALVDDDVEEFAGKNIAGGHWITKDGRKILIGGDAAAGRSAGGGGGSLSDITEGPPEAPIDPEKEGWKIVKKGKIGGHSEANIWEDKNGDLWYVKRSDDWTQQANEVIAGKLYALAGIPHTETRAAVVGGSPWLASKMISHAGDPHPNAVGLREGFATDAWLGNWDVAGLHGENTVLGPKMMATRVESGGALLYRGMQGLKTDTQFTGKVNEIDVFRGGISGGGKTNDTATYLFRGVTEADIAKGIRDHVLAITPAEISKVVTKYGSNMPPNLQSKIINTLTARQEDLKARLPDLDAAAKAAAKSGAPPPPTGKLFNVTHQVVAGNGKIPQAPQPVVATAAQTKAMSGGNWGISNWSDPNHPRPDEFGAPTNPSSIAYAEAMKRAQSRITSWKHCAQSEGAKKLRVAAIEELGAQGMVGVGNTPKPAIDFTDRQAVRVLYMKTQADLAAAGFTNDDRLVLARGLSFHGPSGSMLTGPEAKAKYTTPMALEGFSTNEGTAVAFNNSLVIKKAVPPSSILFSWHTSVGSTGGYAGEKEYFVLHGPKFEPLGSTYEGKIAGGPAAKAAPKKPSTWSGQGPLDLSKLAADAGFTYKGHQTVPKVENTSVLGGTIKVPKPQKTYSGSGGADAFIAKYGGEKYSKDQLKVAFDVLAKGGTVAEAAAAGAINKNSMHGMIHLVKLKYGGVNIGGTTVTTKAGSGGGETTYTPTAAQISSAAAGTHASAPFSGVAASPPPPKPSYPEAQPLKPADADWFFGKAEAGMSVGGTVFDKDVYLTKAGTYFKVPAGQPAPTGAKVSMHPQSVAKSIALQQAGQPEPPKTTPPPAPSGKLGIEAYMKKYGSTKYSPAQIQALLSLKASGMSDAAVAKQLGIPVNTVHGISWKAKNKGYI
jgi:hypothetical protein